MVVKGPPLGAMDGGLNAHRQTEWAMVPMAAGRLHAVMVTPSVSALMALSALAPSEDPAQASGRNHRMSDHGTACHGWSTHVDRAVALS